MKEPETPMEYIVCGLTLGATAGVVLAAFIAVVAAFALACVLIGTGIGAILS